MILAAPVGSVGVYLTAVESRMCAMWYSEVTDSVVKTSMHIISNSESADF
ncbi:MAG: hypothetical protein OFPII_01840 [Osedax symbiont Rs1]|nr:MAG: hypothetical protein OFPII_01840 [Osedax symbiont Rs1]